MSGMGSGGPDDNDAQAGRLALTLSSGSHPSSSAPGRRREDDANLIAGRLGGGNDGVGRRSEDDPNFVYGKARRAGEADASPESWVEDDLTNTLDAIGHGPRTSQAAVFEPGARRLTPVECCRLQGFPDDWLGEPNKQPDSPRYAAMGDAVTVTVAEWIGRRLAEGAIHATCPNVEEFRRPPEGGGRKD